MFDFYTYVYNYGFFGYRTLDSEQLICLEWFCYIDICREKLETQNFTVIKPKSQSWAIYLGAQSWSLRALGSRSSWLA
jgi:hypothetical protein